MGDNEMDEFFLTYPIFILTVISLVPILALILLGLWAREKPPDRKISK